MNIALAYNRSMAPVRLAKVAALAALLEQRGHRLTHHSSADFVATRDAPEADLVCVCGGDGTAQLVVANQPDHAAMPPLAVFPVGTINLLARELGYPAAPAAFAARIEAGVDHVVSRIASINGRAFLCCVSVGADAHAVAAVSEPLKARIGRLAYVVAMAKTLLRWQRQPLRIETEHGAITAEAAFILRGRHYAGPWTLDPLASLGGAKLRLLVLPRARRRDVARLALYALSGSRKRLPHWHAIEAERITIAADSAVPIQIDGDHAPHWPLEFAMGEAAVRFA